MPALAPGNVTPATPERMGRLRLPVWLGAHHPGMRITRRALTRPLVVLALAGALTACGDNSDTDRNEQECGTAENSGDCAETEGPPTQTSESAG